jgi:hypothetical protein
MPKKSKSGAILECYRRAAEARRMADGATNGPGGGAPQGSAIPAQTARLWLKQVVSRASVAADSPVQVFRFLPHLIRGPAQKSRNFR